MMSSKSFRSLALISLLFVLSCSDAQARKRSCEKENWVGTWASSPQSAAVTDLPQGMGFNGATLRQVIHLSVGGKRVRVRFSNAFGSAALSATSAHIALSAGESAIQPSTDKALTFAGRAAVSVPAGAVVISDPVDFNAPALADVALTLYIESAPDSVTSHPGSRTTSYIQPGNAVSAAEMRSATKVDHWYFINGVDVVSDHCPSAVVVLGDSITDGRGSTTNGNDRWPDNLSRRLHAEKKTSETGVLNEGIGGNRLLRDGLGPNALARFDRDVVAQTGVRWLLVLEGVNDIGTRLKAAEKHESWATSDDIIDAYRQIVTRAHSHGIKVYGATILPFGNSFYFSPDTERDRQAINDWIRNSHVFDAVVDFDARMRDEKQPSQLRADFDTGDHLHPNAAGYKAMGDAIDLKLFEKRDCSCSTVGNTCEPAGR